MPDTAPIDPTPSASSPEAAEPRLHAHKTTFELLEVAGRFRNPAAVAALLEACIIESDGDAQLIARTLGAIVHAQGIRDFSLRSGVPCRLLRRELTGSRPPQIATILQVTRTLGISLHVSARRSGAMHRQALEDVMRPLAATPLANQPAGDQTGHGCGR